MFVFGDTYGGLYNNLLSTQQQGASNYFRLAELAQKQDAEEQAAQDNAVRLGYTLQQGALNRQDDLRKQDLEERKFQWSKIAGHVGDRQLEEKKQEFQFGTAGSLADQGEFGNEAEVKKMFPNLPESSFKALAIHSQKARAEIDSQIEPLQAAADTLNELEQLRSSGNPTDWEDTANSAAKIMADKKLMSQIVRDPKGVWKPVAPVRPWAKASATGGYENVSDLPEIEGDVPDTQRLARLRLQFNPPQNLATGGASRFSFSQPAVAAQVRILPMPGSAREAVVGQTYQTANGPAVWNGRGFVK